MYYKLEKDKLNQLYSVKIRCSDRKARLKELAREYYSKNESSMSEERKQEFKTLFKEIWGEEL